MGNGICSCNDPRDKQKEANLDRELKQNIKSANISEEMSTTNWRCHECEFNDKEINVDHDCERCKKKKRIISDLKDLQNDCEPIDPFLFKTMDLFDINDNHLNTNNDNKKEKKEEKQNELTYYNDSKYVSLLTNKKAAFMCVKGHPLSRQDKHLKRGHCIMCNHVNGGNKNIKQKPNKNELLKFLNEYVNKNKIQFGHCKDQKG
eukprot:179926_1